MHGGYWFWVYSMLGDMDFYQNDLGTAHQANMDPKDACPWCTANKTTRNWFDFRPSAPWRKSQPRPRASDHQIYNLRGFTTWHFGIDWLHVMDLGVSCHAIGNVLADVVFRRLGHLSKEAAMVQVTNFIYDNDGSVEHGRLPPSLDLKNFTTPKSVNSVYPILAHVKASEAKALVPRVAELARDLCDGSQLSVHLKNMMGHLEKMYNILHDSGYVLGDAWPTFDSAATKFLLEYNWCADSALAIRPYVPRFSFVPKHHYLAHLAQQARVINPKYIWAYGGEDFVGKASDLAHSCLRGTPVYRVPTTLMERYRLGMHMQLRSRL